MRKSVIALTTAAVMGFGGSALAGDPVLLSDNQMDNVVAGSAHTTNVLESIPLNAMGTGPSLPLAVGDVESERPTGPVGRAPNNAIFGLAP